MYQCGYQHVNGTADEYRILQAEPYLICHGLPQVASIVRLSGCEIRVLGLSCHRATNQESQQGAQRLVEKLGLQQQVLGPMHVAIGSHLLYENL